MSITLPVDVIKIQSLLPHRYPFLLVDRVIELEPNKRIRAIKNVTINEPFFQGHFPRRPVMPGVLMLEALAQAAALLSFDAMDASPSDDNIYYFAGIDGARALHKVASCGQVRIGRSCHDGSHGNEPLQNARDSDALDLWFRIFETQHGLPFDIV